MASHEWKGPFKVDGNSEESILHPDVKGDAACAGIYLWCVQPPGGNLWRVNYVGKSVGIVERHRKRLRDYRQGIEIIHRASSYARGDPDRIYMPRDPKTPFDAIRADVEQLLAEQFKSARLFYVSLRTWDDEQLLRLESAIIDELRRDEARRAFLDNSDRAVHRRRDAEFISDGHTKFEGFPERLKY